MTKFTICVNGVSREIATDPETPLIFVLRNQLGFTGTKLGCGLETCGACAVLVEGESVLSCSRSVSEFNGKEITTIEGLVSDGKLSPVQQAFLDERAAQCGFCTPGIIIAVTSLISKSPRPSANEISEALEKHLCRCGSHANVIQAINRLAADGG